MMIFHTPTSKLNKIKIYYMVKYLIKNYDSKNIGCGQNASWTSGEIPNRGRENSG